MSDDSLNSEFQKALDSQVVEEVIANAERLIVLVEKTKGLDPWSPSLSNEEKQCVVERCWLDNEYYLHHVMKIPPDTRQSSVGTPPGQDTAVVATTERGMKVQIPSVEQLVQQLKARSHADMMKHTENVNLNSRLTFPQIFWMQERFKVDPAYLTTITLHATEVYPDSLSPMTDWLANKSSEALHSH